MRNGHNRAVIWEATDQFGNMYVGVSIAESWDEAGRDIHALVEELAARNPSFTVTVDCEFGDMNGPNPDQPTHILQLPWICGQEDAFTRVEALVHDAAMKHNVTANVAKAN